MMLEKILKQKFEEVMWVLHFHLLACHNAFPATPLAHGIVRETYDEFYSNYF